MGLRALTRKYRTADYATKRDAQPLKMKYGRMQTRPYPPAYPSLFSLFALRQRGAPYNKDDTYVFPPQTTNQ